MIQFACGCGQNLRVKDELAGRFVHCPRCKATVGVPGSDEPAGEAEEVQSFARPQRVRKTPYDLFAAMGLKGIVLIVFGLAILEQPALAADVTVAFPAGLSILVLVGLWSRSPWGWWGALVIGAVMVALSLYQLGSGQELPASVRTARLVSVALEPVVAALLVSAWWRGAYDS